MKRLAIAALILGLLFLGGGVHSSELGGEDACTDACHQQNASCVSACGTHGNPVQCEATCQDQLDDCLRACH